MLQTRNDPLWFKDAVIYQLHVKTFYDSNGDGIGDFRGLIEKLDYLKNLGITAIWLLPFYPSPLRDDGYDISDYYDINPQYGTLRDFKDLLREAHARDLRVITELVINHTSVEHAWFKRARMAPAGSDHREYYVWSGDSNKYADARIIFKDFHSSNWTWCEEAKAYYWHRFYSHQPDLNFNNPNVQKEIFKVADFWFGLGVDGMRLDAVPYLFEREGTNCENLPETHAFLQKLRVHVDGNFKDKMLLAEANQWPEDAVAYFGTGNECHMAFNFPLMPRMYMAVQMEDRFPLTDILEQTPAPPDNCQWAIFLRNHDELTLEMVTDEERDYMFSAYAKDARSKLNLGIRRRLVPLLGNNRRKIELMNIMLLSLPGTPIVYYGDEIGMGDNRFLGDRDGVRTPMQWSPDRNAGFSRANSQELYLPVISDPEYHYQTVNVETQDNNLSSLLWWVRRVIGMRKRFKAFSLGGTRFVRSENPKVVTFVREYGEEVVLVVINLSRFSQSVEIDLREFAGCVPEELFSQNVFPPVKDAPYVMTLGPHNHFWLQLKKMEAPLGERQDNFVQLAKSWEEMFTGKLLRQLETDILPAYLRKCRWSGTRPRPVLSSRVTDLITLNNGDNTCKLAFINVKYSTGRPENYFLPLAFARVKEDRVIQHDAPESILCYVDVEGSRGFIYDGMHSPDLWQALFRLIARNKKVKGTGSTLTGEKGKWVSLLAKERAPEMTTRLVKGEHNNTSVVFDNAYFMKIFRRIEDGVNPDLELSRFLTGEKFTSTPAFAGSLQYKAGNDLSVTVGVMQEFVPSQSDAWTYTTDHVKAYYDVVLEKARGIHEQPEGETDPRRDKTPGEDDTGPLSLHPRLGNVADLIDPFFLEKIGLLGQRTAQMHCRLAGSTSEADFRPEAFSLLYQRSIYQAMGSQARHVFASLRQRMDKLPPEVAGEAVPVLEVEKQIHEKFKRIIKAKLSAKKIRVHGDYHLGQVLFTGKDFVIIDFEGEPTRPLSERRLKRSALRDVAGMIRSFHYAVYATLFLDKAVREEDIPLLEYAADIGYDKISRVFLDAYFESARQMDFLPISQAEREWLLPIYLLDKAVYELGYELENRPDWTVIPLRGIRDILNTSKKN